MTYFQFHCLFNFPVLIALCLLNAGVAWEAGELLALGAVLGAAVVFTTPWDHFAVMWGIWGFPRHRYAFRIGALPVEEYLFFLLQSMNVMLAVRALFLFFPSWQTRLETPLAWQQAVQAGVVVFIWALVGLWYLYHLPKRSHYYAVHLLFWFVPLLTLQWVLAPAMLWSHIGLLAGVAGAFGLYYSLADYVAVSSGIWYFDDEMITGVRCGVLPWEEIAFFFLTSLLVAQSFLLLLPPQLR